MRNYVKNIKGKLASSECSANGGWELVWMKSVCMWMLKVFSSNSMASRIVVGSTRG